ncbi:QWRF motif-containing protein 2-like [Malania oleifera]|uniref:QWRF motif-containing protein 2-like n=1 Tax=Malania oleifera TaxID=397392 RepID=UPI0025AE7437|nr:QWRF motif-containing protein 2-like [Malania oleifera]XP_057973416.1 QWRF motif-containing protein 2-like [Malania oleifera]
MMVAAVSAAPNPKPSSHRNPVRPPLLPSEGDNGVGPRRPRAREVTSRYMSSLSSTSSSSTSSANSLSSRRSASPIVSRTGPTTAAMTPANKRSQSVERRRPGTPWASTVDLRAGNAAQGSTASRNLLTSARSLSVSFQGESFSLQVSKAKPAPSSNVRKGTPERRKATPARGVKGDELVGADQSENSKPVDQQRWPGRSRQPNIMTRSLDYRDDRRSLGLSGSVVRALQHSMIDGTPKLQSNSGDADLEKAALPAVDGNSAIGSAESSDPVASDTESVSSGSTSGARECSSTAQSRGGPRGIMVPARFWQETNNRLRRMPEPESPQSGSPGLKTAVPVKLFGPKKSASDSPVSSPRTISTSRGLSSPLRGAVRPASPSKLMTSSTSSPMRGIPSPSRVRNLVASTQPNILNFAADVRRGKMGENRIVDAHLLRLLYNRHLQWRFVNARADATMMAQRLAAEKSLIDAWESTLVLRDSVRGKRKELQFLRQYLKLTAILKGQMLYLEEWALLERDHSNSLSGAIEGLKGSTLRLPIVGGARVDIQNVKEAICSADDVMQAMASSICSLLAKVEERHSLVAELANITTQERDLLDQCRDLLSSAAAMQVTDCSLRTHTLQLKRVPPSLTANV